MNKTLLLIGLTLACNALIAQDAIFFQNEDSTSVLDTKRNMLVIDGNGIYDSNSLYNELTLGLLLGRDLDRETRLRSQDELQSDNRLGYEIQAGLTYRHFSDSLFGSGKLGWQISTSHYEVLSVKFTDDLYDVLFFGNAHLADETAYMDGSDHFGMKYQKVGFGIFDKKDLSSITLSLVNGQQYSRNDLRTLSLYTAPDGTFLDLELNGTLESSDSTNMGYGSSNGLGAAVDFEWNLPVSIAGRDSRFSQFSLAVQDLGFVAWNAQSHFAEPDTTMRFEGVTVNDIFDIDGLLPDGSDLLDSIGIHIAQKSAVRMLPVLARLSLRSQFLPRWYAEAGVQFRAVKAYVPYGWMNLSYLPAEHFRITVSGAYGGFGGFRLGVGLETLISQSFYLKLNTSNILGSFSEESRGVQASVGLGVVF